jgi:3-hydroxyacyl-CoA dehydrogenase/3a,7a,12a-trihydroxy-5b-cholest-24-enoyl-CoA hydratase
LVIIDLRAALKPELVAPVVAWMCHENCEDNGVIVEAAAGFAARCRFRFF